MNWEYKQVVILVQLPHLWFHVGPELKFQDQRSEEKLIRKLFWSLEIETYAYFIAKPSWVRYSIFILISHVRAMKIKVQITEPKRLPALHL